MKIPPLLTRWRCVRIDLAALGLAAAAGLLFFSFGLRPVLHVHERRVAQTAQLESQQKDVALMGTRAEGLEQRLREVQAALADSRVQLEPASAVNNRISRLAALAADHGLNVNEIQPAEPVYGDNCGSVPIHLNGNGGYRTWAAFLHAMARSFPDTTVESFQLSGKNEDPGALPDFQVNLVWHVMPRQAPSDG